MKDSNYNKAIQLYPEIAKKFGFTFVDYRALDLKFMPKDFINQDHLSVSGRDKFWPRVLKACFP
jgi:hypothetical protein